MDFGTEDDKKDIGILGVKIKEALSKVSRSSKLKRNADKALDKRDYFEMMQDYIKEQTAAGKEIVVIEWSGWLGNINDLCKEEYRDLDLFFTGTGVLMSMENAEMLVNTAMRKKYSNDKIQQFFSNACNWDNQRVALLERREKDRSKWAERVTRVTGSGPSAQDYRDYIPPELLMEVPTSILYLRPCTRRCRDLAVSNIGGCKIEILEIIDQCLVEKN